MLRWSGFFTLTLLGYALMPHGPWYSMVGAAIVMQWAGAYWWRTRPAKGML